MSKWGPMPADLQAARRVVVSRNVMIPMRDGKRLATDIYRPALENGEPSPGPFPIILTRTSYDKSNPAMQVEPVGNFFAAHGYAVAIQDLRGRGESEDVGNYHHVANPEEGNDGYDTVEWLAAQPWSNGRVGMVGTSHSAVCTNAAALKNPPHLAAAWVDSAPTSGLDWQCRRGGAMAMQMFPALFVHAHDAPEIRNDPEAMARIEWGGLHVRDQLLGMPFKPGETALAAVPNLERILFHYYYDGTHNEFWAMETLENKTRWDQFADVPCVFSTGWYDLFTEEATQEFAELSRRKKSPMKLVVGPWNHTAMRGGGSVVGEVDFGADAAWGYARYNTERLRWFDHWLKGVDNGAENDPPVRMFTMGGGDGALIAPKASGAGVFGTGIAAKGYLNHGGRWRNEQQWPLPEAMPTPFYLREGNRLSTEAPTEAGAASWVHDPDHPVPTLGASVAPFLEFLPMPKGISPDYLSTRGRMTTFTYDGPMHQRERPDIFGSAEPFPLLSERDDVVVFETQPLANAVEVTGQVRVKLWVSSDALDTDFTARLIDVYPASDDKPEGYHMNIIDSILRARFRDGFEAERLMEPRKIYPITIVLPPTSNLFASGHRIRLDIASANFPQFDVNPNTGEPLGRHTRTIRATNTVHFDAAHPSHILLPVMPA
ncbi:MAG: CocE/NonD family hydrolase [Hyphomicrobiales bacterium]|nr:MAG: CocE/NonD family hydrolase [Hyphomicrobiales bacterium]